MKTASGLLFVVLTLVASAAFGQMFNQVYPISDNPNISWKSNLVKSETILFEANPSVKFSFYNDIYQKLFGDKSFGQGYYASFTPELRMYNENSVPVKMPSYRILLGFQHVYKLNGHDLFSYALESGHYSNGQNGCTFNSQYADSSPQSDSVIAAINSKTNLSDWLNRTNGEFSTDLTTMIFNYRFNGLIDHTVPQRVHSLKTGFTYYHDRFLGILPFGGYADNLISIYGHWRLMAAYEYTRAVGKSNNELVNNKNRITLSENIEYIPDAHPFVNPIRSVSTASFFFRNNFGFFASYIYGHDDYNIRFVDAGSQVSFGVCWSVFPLFKIKPIVTDQPLIKDESDHQKESDDE